MSAAWEFNIAVYEEVQNIPYGKVTTYGYIARLIGRPKNPRQVGQALKFLALETSPNTPEFHGGNVPWWRVVNSKYQISARGNKNDETRQSDKLLAEGIDLDALNSDQIWFAEQEQEGGSEEGEEILELDI